MNLSVHPDINKAETLHSDFYTDGKYFSGSKEKIFGRTWQFIGDTDNLRVSGQILPHTMLEGFLNEPVILVRDKSDEIHCLSNVCTHRGNILVENPCIEQNIRCRYHGRKFKLNGEFQSMPEFEGVENFPSEKDNLAKIPFGVWGKFIFASINPAFSLQEALGEMKRRLNFLPLNEFKHDAVRSRDYLVKAHWALYCENYLEGFHIPFIHNSLNSVIDYSAYKTELYNYSNLQLAVSRGGETAFDLPSFSPDFGQSIAAYYYWIFPNLMFNYYPWGLSINVVKPLSTELTKVSFINYVYDESKIAAGAGAMLDKVEREDEAIVENVQKGIRSRHYSTGRYSPLREKGTHHFHRLIAEFMEGNE